MGYACPVCETPQADAGHLANHLAFTAMLGNDDHERWLDEHAPGWTEAGERELAARVVEHAAEVEFPQVFEDTTGGGHDHEHDDPRPGALFEDDREFEPRGRGSHSGRGGQDTGTPSDPGIEQAVAEAREMTRQRRGSHEDDGDGEGNEADRSSGTDDEAIEGGGDESQ